MKPPENDFEISELESIPQPCVPLHTRVCAACDKTSSDVLCLFLKSHLCICKRTAAKAISQDLQELNERFAQKMVDIYDIFRERKERIVELPALWVYAFDAYMNQRWPPPIILASMAAAHILGDLEGVLFSFGGTEEEFNSVFDDIVGCGELAVRGLAKPGSFLETFCEFLQPALDPFKRYSLSSMRGLAWSTAMMRRNLRDR